MLLLYINSCLFLTPDRFPVPSRLAVRISGHVDGSCNDLYHPEQLCFHLGYDSTHRYISNEWLLQQIIVLEVTLPAKARCWHRMDETTSRQQHKIAQKHINNASTRVQKGFLCVHSVGQECKKFACNSQVNKNQQNVVHFLGKTIDIHHWNEMRRVWKSV